MNVQIERELLEEMTLFPPEQNPRAPVKRPPDVQFTREQLEEAAERNPWVKMNIVVPHMAVRRKTPPMTNGERMRGGEFNCRVDIPRQS